MANINTAEAWVIQPRERARYEEQFSSLRPVNGIITGDQAKGFLLQSQLPPPVLGQIWSLADTDADGKMNISEFSIACKLINLKLRNFELPKMLPAVLLQSASQTQVKPQSPPQIPLVGLVNTQPMTAQPPSRPAVPPMIPPLPNPALMHHHPPAMVPMVPSIPTMVPNIPAMVPNIPAMVPNIPAMVPNIPMAQNLPPLLPSIPVVPPMAPIVPMVPIVQPPLRPPSAPPVERVASVESPLSGSGSPMQEWAVPHHSRLKYTQLFNSMDRTRSGFLSGPQARNVMVQSQVAQQVLAQIWTLADMDADGRLSCEEFVLALHLCEMAKQGEKIGALLPPELVPPTMRRQRQSSLTASQSGDAMDKEAAINMLTNTFEDKRKENFDKGQAELERRRKTLLEIQRKEQEERQRKEREEEEKRERVRLEQERRRQQEFERQLERQREAETQEQEQRKRAQEQKENARKEMERQRQQEWEKSRGQELEQQRQKEQEQVLKLKAKNQTLGIELSQLNEQVKLLSGRISETRLGVSGVKTTIDGMRSTRDTQLAEMSALKTRLKEQNQRLITLSQEKSRMEAKNKQNLAQDSLNQEQTQMTFSNKQITLKQLRDRLKDLQDEIETKLVDIDNNNSQLGDMRQQLVALIQECEGLYSIYEDRRSRVLELKTRRDPTDFTQSWGEPDNAWPTEVPAALEEEEAVAEPGYSKYRALYEFVARNGDEISFQPGDTIMVPLVHNAEPGWLAGQIRGHTGWFPESYVEPVLSPTSSASFDVAPSNEAAFSEPRRPLEEIAELAEQASDSAELAGTRLVDEIVLQAQSTVAEQSKQGADVYVALYSYTSPEAGDLDFNAGDVIRVVKKEGDWWTGVVDDRQGIFPSNYVQPLDTQAFEPLPAAVVKPAAVEPIVTAAVAQPVKQEPQPAATAKSPATPDFAAMAASTMGKSRKPEIGTVLANYAATSTEQLSLVRGQLVMIRKKTATGWWEGELQAKGRKRQVGWFPASYVKPMTSGRNTPVSLEQTNKMDTPDLDIRERVVALFPYAALNQDELSFDKDDVIVLLAREEEAWWRGELNGVSGLFPSNYVAAISAVTMSPMERKRQDHINELIQTEESYIQDMMIVHDVFEKPLLASKVLTRQEVAKVFVNWRDIIVCNHTFLRALRVRKEMSAGGVVRTVGDIMCENFPRMSSYVRFCSCQLSAAAFLQQLTSERAEFREVQRACQSDLRTKGMPLSSFLIKPMQRITKYPLIIKKILEYTPDNHPDRQNLQEALAKAEEFCIQVNEGVREKENSERLEWLQQHVACDNLPEQIVFNSMTNSLGPRKFLHHSVLRKNKSGKELLGFLLNDFLLLAQPSKPMSTNHTVAFDRKNNLTCKIYKRPLLLNQLTVLKDASSDSNTDALRLFDSATKLTLNLLAPNANERQLWVKRLDAATRDLLENEKSRIQRQQSKQQLGAVGRVLVLVTEGVGLRPANGKCSAFCEVNMGSQRHRTAVIHGTTEPVWNASMQFLVKDIEEDVLCVTVFDHGHFAPNGFLGRTEVRISDVFQESRDSREPIIKHLLLHEVEAGEIRLKLDLRLFER